MTIIKYFGSRSKPFLMLLSIALTALIALIGRLTGAGLSLFILYLLPVSLAAYSTAGRSAMLLAAAIAIILWLEGATLSAGTEGYGIQAATTGTGSGGTLSINPIYDKAGNNVGGLTTGGATLASSTIAVTNREVVVTHKAAISTLTNAASYKDTITYSCVGN